MHSRKIEELKNIEINPLRLSPSIGAAIFFLGIKNAVVLLHGAVGCASFEKVTLTKHYRENIPIVTTALNEYGAILGGTDFLISGIKNVSEKIKPDFIGILSSGLTETSGEDVFSRLLEFKKTLSRDFPAFVYASTPDFKGGLEDGYRDAMIAFLKDFLEKNKFKGKNLKKSVNVFCPSSCTPQDFLELREVIECYGYRPLMVPDLGTSLDGHLDKDGYLQATSGGFDIKDGFNLLGSEFNILAGSSLKNIKDELSMLTGLETFYFPNLSGLKNTDAFFRLLSKFSGRQIPEKYARHRRQLMDAYLDSHFYFSGKNIAIALSEDWADSFSTVYSEIGANIEICVTTRLNNDIKRRCTKYFEGDLDLLDNYTDLDLIISNSNAKFYAKNLGIPLFKTGFPVIDCLGNGFKHYILYKGAINLVTECANLLDAD